MTAPKKAAAKDQPKPEETPAQPATLVQGIEDLRTEAEKAAGQPKKKGS